jgi:hypothetical protein
MLKLASITFGVAGLFLVVLPTTSYAQDCRGLRWACEHKEELGAQGAGICRRYREQCGGGGGFGFEGGGFRFGFGGGGEGGGEGNGGGDRCAKLRWACEHKDELGLQGAGTCRRFRETCS